MSKKAKPKKQKRKISLARLRARLIGYIFLVFLFFWSWVGVWFIHHSPSWLEETCSAWPKFITSSLFWVGEPVGDFTDALGLTGTDVVYEYDEEAPSGSVTFAGIPRRIGNPAPDDIIVLKRGEFLVGWSSKLRHPAWVAYHVPAVASHQISERPKFKKDSLVSNCPDASAYKSSGYDRGHMAPNYAMVSRFGEETQKKTFLMSNISPQTPTLNRGVWRELEHRIADLWTARWGEIWVIVGAIPSSSGKKFGAEEIDVPDAFYQLVVAQEGMDVRAFAVIFNQDIKWGTWPTRALVTIDELEEKTGFDFLSELPDFIQRPLEASRPTRLWPVRKVDMLRPYLIRFANKF